MLAKIFTLYFSESTGQMYFSRVVNVNLLIGQKSVFGGRILKNDVANCELLLRS